MTSIHYEQSRYYCTDNEGVIHIIATSPDFQLTPILRHETHRSLMRSCVLDDVTLAVSDKYGDILVYRSLFPVGLLTGCDGKVTDLMLGAEPEVLKSRTESGYAVGARSGADVQMTLIAGFYVGEVVTSLFKQASPSKADVLMYATINGTIGCLAPIDDMEKLKTIVAIESLVIGKGVSLVGRVVDDFRSSFVPSMVRERRGGEA